ncbi:reverse transcriptase domain-containing protein, partial [Tanacetum coccineum]
LLEDKVLLKLDWDKNQKTKSSLKKTIAFATEGNSNSDTDKIMSRMDAMTMKMDAQYKDFQSRSKQSKIDDNDIPIHFYGSKNKLETTTKNHQASIQNLEAKFDRFADKQSSRPSGSLPSNTQPNPKVNPNDQQNDSETPINFDSDDEDDEPTPQPKPKNPKPVKEAPTPKPYKPKIPYPQRLRKEKMEAQYGKFLNIIRAVRINFPLVDVLAEMPYYGKFIKELVNSKHKIEQISAAFLSDESSAILQNKVPPKLGDPRSLLIPCNFNKDFSCNALADLGASINLMPGKFTFRVDFVILEMEEDNKVPLILERPFLYTADVIPIDPMEQEKTTFTCPFGTYAYRRVPFGLCNAPATFQRCMLAIFHDMIEESVKVFMDDFFVFGSSFGHCLNNLDKMLQRCEDALLVLNCKTLNAAQQNYTIIKKELMAAVFAFDKFRSYLVLSKTIVHTDHSALRHLFKKQDAKPRLISDHLSRIEKEETSDDSEVDDNFPGETLMEINTEDDPWFVDFANYLVSDIIPKGMTYQQKNNFFSNIKHYFWEEPYLFKWAEAQALPTNDARVVITFMKKLFCRFEMPKALIKDRGTHFCNKIMEKTMKDMELTTDSLHHTTLKQVAKLKNTNRALKRILKKNVKDNPAI